MANKLKKPASPKAEEKPIIKKAPVAQKFKADKEEKVDFKKLAKDERTWKIIGTLSLLVSIFLFIAFISYFFTWKEDQDKVFNNSSFLFDNTIKVSNLLGRLGAYMSHLFIRQGFGVASMLVCTFFFVVGINLLVNRKVFSIWKNLRYVTIGLLIASVSFAFLFSGSHFPFGGEVGKMIDIWLENFLGTLGTAVLLLVVGVSYLIWQFNPSFKIPERQPHIAPVEVEEEEAPEEIVTETLEEKKNKRNALKSNTGMLAPVMEDDGPDFEIIERDEEEEESITSSEPIVEREITKDLLHEDDLAIEPIPELVPIKVSEPTLPQ
ncbi:MAG TPA: DNA translocase FtsK 4TM domain-containing protein, partial [Chitinophagaceae bacterium]|nr:DNA translocase FtsK 4TM domain-containing protein [Chitinophagaceae bacterium]